MYHHILHRVKKNGKGLGVPSHEVDMGGGGGVSNKVYTESEFVLAKLSNLGFMSTWGPAQWWSARQ